MHRAYSLLTVKSVDEDARIITGIATSPTPDRIGDIVESDGGEFKLPIPLLWMHDSSQPIGEVFFAKVTKHGIEVKARVLKIAEPGTLKDRLDEAWLSIKHGLVKGLSIGFRSIEYSLLENGGLRFLKWLWLELSAVTIPANQDASIQTIKSLDAPHLAASGKGDEGDLRKLSAGVTAFPSVSLRRKDASPMKKTYTEQIASVEATLQTKRDDLHAIQAKVTDENRTKDASEREAFDELKTEIGGLEAELVDLKDLEVHNQSVAKAVDGTTTAAAAASRGPAHVIRFTENVPPGMGFARVAIAKMVAYMSQGMASPLDVAKMRWPSDERVQHYIKTAVAAGTTVDSVWAAPLIDQTNLTGEFIAFLRKMTILGKFGTDGIPPLRPLLFNVRIPTQTTGGSASWVGEGAPKPLTKFNFDAVTIPYTKVAAIAVITKELARFSSPSAEAIVRDQLAKAVVERMDIDFIDPNVAAVSGVKPASITNGVTALSSAGTSADNARTDIMNLLEQYILNNVDPTGLVLIMPNTLALALSIMRNSLGQQEFPGLTLRGGVLEGIPVITSQHAAHEGANGNMLIAVNANDVGLADDGGVDVSVSGEASLNMDDAPTNNSATPTATTVVSMFQTNSLAILAERFIHWKKLRSTAVVWMDDVNWGSIGSPV